MVQPNKTHKLVVGIYDPENGERLPLENDSSNENVLELRGPFPQGKGWRH
jgi:hypothetical protein